MEQLQNCPRTEANDAELVLPNAQPEDPTQDDVSEPRHLYAPIFSPRTSSDVRTLTFSVF